MTRTRTASPFKPALDTPFQRSQAAIDAALQRAIMNDSQAEPPKAPEKAKPFKERNAALYAAYDAMRHMTNREWGKPQPTTIAGMNEHMQQLRRMESQCTALLKLTGAYDESPETEIEALEAICALPEAWRMVRVTKAARRIEADIYEVPSESRPGIFYRVRLGVTAEGKACGCEAKRGTCHHIEAAKHVAHLYAMCRPLIQVDVMATAAYDRAGIE